MNKTKKIESAWGVVAPSPRVLHTKGPSRVLHTTIPRHPPVAPSPALVSYTRKAAPVFYTRRAPYVLHTRVPLPPSPPCFTHERRGGAPTWITRPHADIGHQKIKTTKTLRGDSKGKGRATNENQNTTLRSDDDGRVGQQ